MPTNRKRTRRQSQAEPWITEYLLYGYYTLPSGKRSILKTLLFGETPVPDWADVEAELLPAWIADHPGTRPWAWWEEEAPGRRGEGESELDFLKRHNLLTDRECRLLTGRTLPR